MRNGLVAFGLSLVAVLGSAQEVTPTDAPPTLMDENRLVVGDPGAPAAVGQRAVGEETSFSVATAYDESGATSGTFGSAEASALSASYGTAAGRTSGAYSITSTGAATYQIPLWTPPGVGTVKLALALVYNSRSGNGVLGQGWSLSGLPSISRCNRTWAQNGISAPIAYSASDRYCLDGQQLKLVSGAPGMDGSVYATEVESFSRIVVNGNAGGGPASFTVTTKNGLVYEYGVTADSKVYHGGTGAIHTWALSRIHDRGNGASVNAVSISYANDSMLGNYTNGTYRVASISYPTTATGQGPFYTVTFSYSVRPAADPIVGFRKGSLVQEPNKLDSITTTHLTSGAVVKAYNFSYTQGSTSNRLTLASIQECSATACLAPTAISYQQGARSWNAPAVGTSLNASAKAATIPVDINGDGLTDLVYPTDGTNNVVKWWAAIAQPGGFSAAIYTGFSANKSVRLIPGKFLGNGRTQLLVPNGTYYSLLEFNGASFQASSTGLVPNGEFSAGDVDGDGLDDLISVPTTNQASVVVRRNTTVPIPGGSAATFSTTTLTVWTAPSGYNIVSLGSWKVVDFNADGRADIAAYTALTSDIAGGTLTFLYWQPLFSNGFGGPFTPGYTEFTTDASTFVTGDWNADGCTDLLHVTKVLISDCAGSFASLPTGLTSVVGNALLPVDWDEDGRTDLVYVSSASGNSPTKWYVARSTGSGIAAAVPVGVDGPHNTAWFPFDQDGDGKMDLGWRDDGHSGWIRYHLHKSAGTPADLAVSFTDGFGMSQAPVYASIAISNYTKDTGAAFPEQDYQGPLYVVKRTVNSDGIGGNYQTDFQYTGARVHVQGRGFEGFRVLQATDSRNGQSAISYFKLPYPYSGMLSQQTVQPQATGTAKLGEWTATFGSQTFGSALEQRHFPYVQAVTDERWEVSGTTVGSLVTRTAESYEYGDSYGNLTRTQRTVTDLDGTSPFSGSSWTTTIVSSYSNTPSSNCFGLPTLSTVTSTAPGQATRTRTSSYQVDPSPCRIWQQVVEPNIATLKVATTLGFDDCGNINSIEIIGSKPDGAAMPARKTQFNYGTRCQLPESVINPLLQSATIGYDYRFGAPSSVIDPNGLATSWEYDDFGRRAKETRPDQTTTWWTLESCATGPCWGQNDLRMHVYETNKGSDGSIYGLSEQLYDGFDRPRLNQYMRILGVWVTESSQYDSLGRLIQQTNPASAATNGYQTWEYDLIDRPVARKLYQPNGTLDRTYRTAYNGRTVKFTDPLGRDVSQVYDVVGRLRRVIDPAPGGTIRYDYDALGNLNRIQDAIGAVSSGSYNERGFRTQWTDADRGGWTFTGNSLNELVAWTDARGQSFSQEYDDLGRVKKRIEPEGTSLFNWGNSAAARNIGRLESKSGYGYSESYTYDSSGRVATRKISTDQDYYFDYAYNAIGEVDTLTYPTSPVPAGGSGTRVKVKYGYSYGAVSSVSDVTDAPVVLWSLASANDYESPTGEALANGVTVTSAYKAWTNELSTRQAGVSPSTTNRQNLSYQWDTAGNLTQRQDVLQGLSEVFTPDALDRVKSSTLNGVQNLSVDYDASGNITSKTDVGAYTYGDPNHPHAATAIGTHTYSYDANGNQITRDGASQAWASYNLPLQVAQPIAGTTYLSQFSYGPDHQRWKQVASYSNGSETTYYVGELLEREVPSPGVTQWRHYVPLPSGMTVLISRGADNQKAVRYLLVDHLGSTDRILNEGGTQVAALSYSSFAARRGSNWSSSTSPDWANVAGNTRQGYTGHENLDNVQLIHMNGRVYDPAAGRFLSVDPLIGDMEDSQQVNPYAYVGNRPLIYTDPSGYCIDGCVSAYVGTVVTQAFFQWVFGKILGGILGGGPPPPPASTMPGPSAQSGNVLCQSAGWWAQACHGSGGSIQTPGINPMGLNFGGLGGDSSPSSADGPYQPEVVEAAEIIISFIPVANSVLGVYQLYKVIRDPNSTSVDVVIATAGVIPYGGIVKKGAIIAKKAGVLGAIVKAGEKGVARGIVPKPSTRVRPPGVPENWRVRPSDSPGGVKYSDPKNPGNQVRVEQGNPNSPYPNSREPYVRDLRNGQYRDAQGNVVPRSDPSGHIPLDQYSGYRP